MRYPVPRTAEHAVANDEDFLRRACANALEIPTCSNWAMVLDQIRMVKFKADILDESKRQQEALALLPPAIHD